MAERLTDKKIEIIFTSPLKRANQTAEILAQKIDRPKFIIDNLKEANLGAVEGHSKEENIIKFPEQVQDWYDSEKWESGFPEGETKREIAERFMFVLNRLAKEDDHKVIALSTHGAMMRCLFLHFGFGIEKIPNTAVYHLRYENEKWDLVS